MRGSLMLVLATLVLPAASEAQLAVKGGFSFASASESAYLPNVGTKTGFTAGISMGMDVGKVLEIRPELLFVQKGGKLDNDSFTLNEINIPINLQVDVPIVGFMPYVYAGPQAEVELTCTVADVDCIDTKSLRWGFNAGLGIRLAKAFSIEGRYNWTVTKISEVIDSKPQSISLLGAIYFGAQK